MALRRLSLVMLLAIVVGACAPETLTGTDLGMSPAPDFTLTDGVSGSTLRLSSLRPSSVVLAFLYTQCPDTCPLTAEKFRQTQEKLGADASKVAFVAVSVDPLNDTPANVHAFTKEHRLSTGWHYLIGSQGELQPVWARYAVRGGLDATGHVAHSDAIYLIDGKGNERTLIHSDASVDDMTKDLRILTR
ncbi:MAG: SCO family protein [Chloroflexota bacterium]|nr:SCO family protein [Chloroflexota bacterium]MDE3192818.1 SCO family protein [Chloroflexota bacterium]